MICYYKQKNKLKKGNIKMNELIEKWYEVREEELTKAYKNTNRKNKTRHTSW